MSYERNDKGCIQELLKLLVILEGLSRFYKKKDKGLGEPAPPPVAGGGGAGGRDTIGREGKGGGGAERTAHNHTSYVCIYIYIESLVQDSYH